VPGADERSTASAGLGIMKGWAALMDWSKLDQNDKLAVYGAVAGIVGPILASVGYGFGVGWLTLLLSLAMLAIVFMPQISPQTTLPGSKGSLMVLVGGIAGVSALLALLAGFGLMAFFGGVGIVGWLIGIAGGLLMGWAGWQAFQAEGGKFRLGTTAAPPSAAPPPTASTEAPPPAPMQTPPPPPPMEPPAAQAPPPMEQRDEENRPG
jgi:hypothetical protein